MGKYKITLRQNVTYMHEFEIEVESIETLEEIIAAIEDKTNNPQTIEAYINALEDFDIEILSKHKDKDPYAIIECVDIEEE